MLKAAVEIFSRPIRVQKTDNRGSHICKRAAWWQHVTFGKSVKGTVRESIVYIGTEIAQHPTAARLICDMKPKARRTGDGGEPKHPSPSPDPTLGNAGEALQTVAAGGCLPSLGLLSQQTHCCCLFIDVKSEHPILDSISGLLARPNPLACLTTIICPSWLACLAFRLSIRAALKLVQHTSRKQLQMCSFSKHRRWALQPPCE